MGCMLTFQLHSYLVFLGHNSLLLCDEIIDDMLLMQLQLTFTMFLLEILCKLLDFGKCCFNNFRNVLPIFVLMLREKRGLTEIILVFCYFLLVLSLVFIFGMKTKGSLTPLSFNASEYIGVAFWKISLIDDRSDSLLLIDLGNSLHIVFGWLEFLLMYTGRLYGFLYSS